RLALAPLIGTGAGSPRRAQAARSGGSSRTSVSSSHSRTLCGGSCRSRLRIRRFFLALRVRREFVGRPLPDVAPSVELSAKGVVGGPPAAVGGEVPAPQGHRPVGRRVVPGLRRVLQGGQQDILQLPGQYAGAIPAPVVPEGLRVAVCSVGVQPVV